MGKFCSECGTQYIHGPSQKFCGECGAPNNVQPQQQPHAEQQQQSSPAPTSDRSCRPSKRRRESLVQPTSKRESPLQPPQVEDSAPGEQLYPFEVDTPLDHCETSSRAHTDIAVLLDWYCKTQGKDPSALRIYDPYYCDGAVVRNMAAAGFPKVYNRPEDFYKVVADQLVPAHDVVITNPPYSEDHIRRCLQFCIDQPDTPWCVLLPNYVSTNDYFKELLATTNGVAPVYLVPLQRYDYYMPEHAREHARDHVSKDDGKTSPFLSSWYIWFGPTLTNRAYQYLDRLRLEWVVAKSAKGSKYKIKNRRPKAW